MRIQNKEKLRNNSELSTFVTRIFNQILPRTESWQTWVALLMLYFWLLSNFSSLIPNSFQYAYGNNVKLLPLSKSELKFLPLILATILGPEFDKYTLIFFVDGWDRNSGNISEKISNFAILLICLHDSLFLSSVHTAKTFLFSCL